jgi:hypothetical protein
MRHPALPQGFEASPAVVRGEGDAEELAELAIEVGHSALGPGQLPELDVGEVAEFVGEQSQGHRLAGTGLSGNESETALAHLVLDAPAEVVELGRAPEGLHRDVRGEGVPLEAVESEQRLFRWFSSCLGM